MVGGETEGVHREGCTQELWVPIKVLADDCWALKDESLSFLSDLRTFLSPLFFSLSLSATRSNLGK